MNFYADEEGYFGEFGGAYVPEMLFPAIESLRTSYLAVSKTSEFERELRELLRDYVGRPSPLYWSPRLSERYGCELFLKREDLNHTGSHKINNVLGQVLVARALGRKRIIAETGAGQHGVATATACARFGLPCVVYMGAVDVERQSPNVRKMRMLGATVVPVTSGSQTLKDATNEAIRDWIANPNDTHYIIGSAVGPHPFPSMVAQFQSIISDELRDQLLSQVGRSAPDWIIACVGGGSNAIGIFYHFLDNAEVKLVGVEAAGDGVHSGRSAATLALGSPGVLHGSKTIVMQDSGGQVLEAHSISAGLDYPGIGPQHAHLSVSGRVRYEQVTDREALEAAVRLARYDGIIPALESAHAFAWLERRQIPAGAVVVVNCSGDGEKDMATYLSFVEQGGGSAIE
jgi:tryptophan synthase beta chain